MTDIANFVAQNFNPARDQGNALALAENLRGSRTRNDLLNQRIDINNQNLNDRNAVRDALQAGDVNALARINPGMASQLSQFETAQTAESAKRLSAFSRQIASSKNPRALAASLLDSPDLQKVGDALGIDFNALNLEDASDEEVRESAALMADAAQSFLGAGNRLQSVRTDEEGNLIQFFRDGRTVNTGIQERNPQQIISDATGVRAVDRLNPQNVQTITSGQELAAAEAAQAGQVQSAREEATTEAIPGQTAARTQGQRRARFIDEGIAASDSLPVINRSLELLDTVETGGIAAAQLSAQNLLGVTGADEAELSANLGKAVLSQLRSTFGAAFTEREGARLERIEASFGKSTAGNVRLLKQIKAIAERTARRGIKAAEEDGDTTSADLIRESIDFRLSGDAQPNPGRFTITEIP